MASSPLLPPFPEASSPAEKAALIAEAVFESLPEATARVARRCAILHWFDEPIVGALLEGGSEAEVKSIYAELASLPFIETITHGLTYHDLTRQGLVSLYARTQPDILTTAARLAAPVYEAHPNGQGKVEAFFCFLAANQAESATRLFNQAMKTLTNEQAISLLERYFRLQDEAELLPFVTPLPRDHFHWLYRALTHFFEKAFDDCFADLGRAIALKPDFALTYAFRGAVYAESKDYAAALADYTRAIELDPNLAQAYNNRGSAHADLKDYAAALADYTRAIELDPNDVSPIYNTACTYGLQGQAGPACEWLRRAVQMDNKYVEMARTDSDFDPIRNTSEFQALLKGFEAKGN